MTSKNSEEKFNLSESQMTKLAQAHKNRTGVTLRLNRNMISPTGIPLMLTQSERRKINDGYSHDITISASRVKTGGFLPALIAALPTIASIIGGVSGLTGIASNIKNMVEGKGKARGVISDLNIPIISPIAKVVGLGNKKRKKSKGLYLSP